MAELVDALVLGTSGATRGGSSPLARTVRSNSKNPLLGIFTVVYNRDTRIELSGSKPTLSWGPYGPRRQAISKHEVSICAGSGN